MGMRYVFFHHGKNATGFKNKYKKKAAQQQQQPKQQP
jgi:hypothetical protein